MSDFTECFYDSDDGLKLFYRDYNYSADDAPAVICLPGLTRNSSDFNFIASHIATSRRVLAPDFRGRGRSEYDPVMENYVPATYAQDMITLIDKLALDRVICLGTSLGGLVSMLLASMIPDRITQVILNDVGAEIDPAGLARISSYAGQQGPVSSWQEAVEQAKVVSGIAFPGRSKKWWMTFAKNIYSENESGVPVLAHDPLIGVALLRLPGAPEPNAGWLLFDNIKKVPTLLIRGAISDILSADIADDMKAVKPDLILSEIPGVGHAPTLEEPEAVVAIDGFLSK